MEHANAPFTPNGRLRMVLLVEAQGMTFEQAAACSGVAKSTVWEWVWRWRRATSGERTTLACLTGRSSRPRRSPRMLAAELQERCCEVRRRTGWGPRLIATEVELAHASVHRALRRAGISRPEPAPREAVVRYEWPCPGDLLHMDVKRFVRFTRPGHAVTGDRHRSGAEKRMRVGFEFAHSIVDDHTRLAYTELHADERAPTVVAFMERALVFFAGYGIEPQRLMTDGCCSYVKATAVSSAVAVGLSIVLKTVRTR